MALTLTPVKGANYAVSNKRTKVFDVTLDNSYATGGYTLAPATVGFKVIDQVHGHGFRKSDNTAHVAFALDRTNNKIVVFSGGTQVANATDLSAYSGRITVIGSGLA